MTFLQCSLNDVYFIIISGIWLPWSAAKNKYILSGQLISVLHVGKLQDCMSSCLTYEDDERECTAVSLDTTSQLTCALFYKSTRDEQIGNRTVSRQQLFSRPLWYSGKRLHWQW